MDLDRDDDDGWMMDDTDLYYYYDYDIERRRACVRAFCVRAREGGFVCVCVSSV